ncbi:MAG: MMPL family transporter [Myxococcales bacterium]|nr:MMPL family transporter [Myxococcota bacterium]MDW8283182.1 MMPL family transporter [Myxococcales bacterium]
MTSLPSQHGVPNRVVDRLFDRLFAGYVRFAERKTSLVLGALGLLALSALVPVSQLELRTDLVELLPEHHPAVRAIRTVTPRQKSATNLVMIIESPDQEANRRFAEALRPRLEAMIPRVFTEIQWRPDTEGPEFAARWRWLYAERADLERAEALLDRIIARRTSPFLVDLEGDPEQELSELRRGLEQKVPPRSQTDYFLASEDGLHYLGIMLWKRRDGLATAGDFETMAAVRSEVRRLRPTSFHPKLTVRYTGHIAHVLDDSEAIRNDLTLATLLCGTLVFLAIYSYFRRPALLLVVGAPAVLGLLLALVLARFTIQHLNMNTSFLISIILGNGINTPIILVARFGEERSRGLAVGPSLARAMSSTLLATITAVAAASIAYGCLLGTSFRGFSQFGLVGGAGMLLVWLMAFLLVPPMIIWGERRWPGLFTPRMNLWERPFAAVGRLAERYAGWLGLASLALVVAAIVPLVRYAADPLEWNFENLRSEQTEAQRLWGRMEMMGMGAVGAGHIGNDGVLLVDRPEQADVVAEAIRAKDRALGARHVLSVVRTLNSVLPSEQDEKLEILARIRRKIDRHMHLMTDEERREVDRFRPPDYLRRIGVDDLPQIVREAFTEIDGTRGRLIGIDADPTTFYAWNGRDLLRIAEVLQVEAEGKTWVAASTATVFAGMISTIIQDGPRITLAALVGVSLLMLLSFGWPGALPVLVSLSVGLCWLGGLLGAIGLKLNFMNFVGLPITLGIGADYAANIWARLRQGRDRVRDVITHTGSAVALCSLTTIIGYSSLLLSHNRALRSFGLLADLGEVTCLMAALLVLPILAQILARRQARLP